MDVLVVPQRIYLPRDLIDPIGACVCILEIKQTDDNTIDGEEYC